jgi:hypothetical protein
MHVVVWNNAAAPWMVLLVVGGGVAIYLATNWQRVAPRHLVIAVAVFAATTLGAALTAASQGNPGRAASEIVTTCVLVYLGVGLWRRYR